MSITDSSLTLRAPIRVDKPIGVRFRGTDVEAIAQYEESQNRLEDDRYYFDNLEAITSNFYGSIFSVLGQDNFPCTVFNVVHWCGDLPTRTRLPFDGESGQLYARAVGELPWLDGTTKLWSVMDDQCGTQPYKQTVTKTLVMTFGGNDEKAIKRNGNFEELDIFNNWWLSYDESRHEWKYTEYSWKYKCQCMDLDDCECRYAQLVWVKLCVLRNVSVENFSWDFVECM